MQSFFNEWSCMLTQEGAFVLGSARPSNYEALKHSLTAWRALDTMMVQ